MLSLLCCRWHDVDVCIFCLPLARNAAGGSLLRTHGSWICGGNGLCSSTTSGLNVIGLVYYRLDARVVKVIGYTGLLYGSKIKKQGLAVLLPLKASRGRKRRLASFPYSNMGSPAPLVPLSRQNTMPTQPHSITTVTPKLTRWTLQGLCEIITTEIYPDKDTHSQRNLYLALKPPTAPSNHHKTTLICLYHASRVAVSLALMTTARYTNMDVPPPLPPHP
jgi:hypothetical protein